MKEKCGFVAESPLILLLCIAFEKISMYLTMLRFFPLHIHFAMIFQYVKILILLFMLANEIEW